MQERALCGLYSSKNPYEHSISVLAGQGKGSNAAVPYQQVTAAVLRKESQDRIVQDVHPCTFASSLPQGAATQERKICKNPNPTHWGANYGETLSQQPPYM